MLNNHRIQTPPGWLGGRPAPNPMTKFQLPRSLSWTISASVVLLLLVLGPRARAASPIAISGPGTITVAENSPQTDIDYTVTDAAAPIFTVTTSVTSSNPA